MRWDILFDDLASQLDRELAADEAELGVEEERQRLARLAMRDRLVALGSAPVVLLLAGGGRHRVRIVDVGRDWAAVDADGPPAWSGLVPIAAVVGIVLPADAAAPRPAAAGHPALAARLGLTIALRDLCRRRRRVELEIDAGGPESGMLGGTIDRVGGDHLDLAVHPPDEPRRRTAVTEIRVVPFDRLRVVRLP